MSRNCVNNPDNFCYICGEVTFASRKCSITPTIKKAYFLYFGCKVGDQGQKMGTTCVLHYVFIQTQCVGEWKRMLYAVWSAHGLEGAWQSTVLAVISVWCPLFKMVCVWKKNRHLWFWIYHQQFGLCLMAMGFLFLKLRTILHLLWQRRLCFFKQRRKAAITFKRCRLLAKHRLLQS